MGTGGRHHQKNGAISHKYEVPFRTAGRRKEVRVGCILFHLVRDCEINPRPPRTRRGSSVVFPPPTASFRFFSGGGLRIREGGLVKSRTVME